MTILHTVKQPKAGTRKKKFEKVLFDLYMDYKRVPLCTLIEL